MTDITALEMATGYVVAVKDRREGAVLTVAASSGATAITVDDIDAFLEDGGQAEIVNDLQDVVNVISYEGVDEDTSQLIGVVDLVDDFEVDDRVFSLPIATTRYASIIESEEDGPIDARVPHMMYTYLPTMTRSYSDGTTVQVTFFFDGFEFVVFDILGTVPVIDGTYIDPDTLPPVTITGDGDPPAYSPDPDVLGGPMWLLARWEPVPNADTVTYEVHVSDTTGFTPDATTRYAEADSISLMFIYSLADNTPLVADDPYYVKIIAKDIDGAAAPSAEGTGTPVELPSIFTTSDGIVPSTTPTPTLVGGVKLLYAKWTAITNADLTTYDVHLGTTSGFTPSGGTLLINTLATSVVILKTAAGADLSYGQDYYVKVLARDLDGVTSATPVASNAAQIVQVDGPDITAGAIGVAQFADGIRPVEIVSVLPTLPDADFPQGAVVFLTTDNKLYRSTGTAWTAEVSTVNITSDGSPPSSSPTPGIVSGPGFIMAKWVAVTNNDLVIYDVHISTTTGFTPGIGTKIGETTATSFVIPKYTDGSNLSTSTTYYVKLVARDADGSAAAGSQGSGSPVGFSTSVISSDGAAPGSSPTPSVTGGIGIFAVKWTPITNNDPVVYEVHVSTSNGFTPSGGTKYGETAAGSMVVRTDAGGGALAYGTTYYFRIISRDADGSAAASSQASASLVQVNTPDIIASAITTTLLSDGAVSIAKFASGIRPVSILGALPANPYTGYVLGDVVFLTTDKKLYRLTDTSASGTTGWTANVSTSNVVSDGAAPGSSPTPTLTAGPSFILAKWTGVVNNDLVTYDVHISTTTGFTPSGGTKIGETTGTSFVIPKYTDGSNLSAATTYYVKLVARDVDGSAAAGSQASASPYALPSNQQTTDGAAPGSSPTPTVTGGIGILAVNWTPISNNDPVIYEVHLSTSTGFTPSGGTKYGETSAGSMVIRTAIGGGALAYGTTYYVKIISRDADGSAAASTQGSGSLVQVANADLGSGSVGVAQFASGIRPVSIVGALPSNPYTGYVLGDVIFLTTDKKLYRMTNMAGSGTTGWVSTTSSSDVIADGAAPGSSPTPTVTAGPGFITASWAKVTNNDLVTYEVHISTTTGFTASGATKIGETTGLEYVITKYTDGSNLLPGTTYYVKTIAKDVDGSAASSSQGSGTPYALPSSAQATDGSAPSSSPTPTVLGGIGIFAVKWTPITNNDPVTYEVHISTSTGFTPSGGTKYAETAAGSIVIRTDAAGAALVYGTTYYVKIIAKDADGSAAASSQGSATLVKAVGGSSGDIAATTITAANIAADTITANEIAANAITTSELNAGAVTAAKIAANTITAAQIAADTITATEIAANAITTTELNANAVTAAKIAANTITAAQIAAGTITATEIAANTITAAQIAANTITAAQIAADTITAGQIAAGAISTSEIAAGAITTDKLVVGDFDNVVGDPSFEDGANGWTLGANTSVTTDNTKAHTGNKLLSYTGTAAIAVVTENAYHSTQPNDKVYAEAWFNTLSASTGNINIAIRWYDRNKAALSDSSGTAIRPSSYTLNTVVGTAPASAAFYRIAVLTTGTTNGTWYVDDIYARRMVTGSIIVDGTITAVEIAANTITASQIAAGTITATQIATGTITSNEIAANTITAADIAANTITAAQIQAGTITTTEIAANTIVAGDIAAGTITTTEIAANTITAGDIAAGTITATEIAAATITGAKIAASTITAGNIAADTITAGQIAAAAISTSELAANAVTADKMTIGHYDNAASNPGFERGDTEWTKEDANATIVNNSSLAHSGSWVAQKVANSANTGFYLTTMLPVSAGAGEEWYAEAYFKGSGTANGSGVLYVLQYDAAAALLRTTQLQSTTVTTSWQKLSGSVALPSDCHQFRVAVRSSTGLTTGTMYFDDVYLRRRATGELIVDGTITALKIAASTITAAQIAAGTITTTQIAANTILAANIAAGTITTTEIAANTITAGDIAAATITGTQIAAATITATNIAANTITSNEILAGTIVASDIASGTITATQIATGTITATQIATGTITATQIAAATITGGKIAANTITASNIAADTITAGEIAAAAISTSELAAGAVTTTKMTIGSFDNTVANPGFEVDAAGADWTLTSATIGTTTPRTGTRVATVTAISKQRSANQTAAIDQMFYAEVYARRTGGTTATTARIGLSWRDSAGAEISQTSGTTTAMSTTYALLSVTGTAPSGTASVHVVLEVVAFDATNVLFDDVYARRMLTGSLIVDGTLTAAKIQANTITASLIAAGTITSTEIAAGTITALNIATGTLTANEIAAGTITSNKIAANTIVANNIAAGTLTANEIAALTITGDKIAANTIDAQSIKTSTLSATITVSGLIATPALTGPRIEVGNPTHPLRSIGTELPYYVNYSTLQTASGTGPITGVLPAGWQQDDVCVVFVTWGGTTGTLTPPSGWTLIRTDSASVVQNAYYRVLQAGDADPQWSWTTARTSRLNMLVYRGVDTSNPIHTHSGHGNTSSTAISPGSVTTLVRNCMIIWNGAWAGTPDITTKPTGFTELITSHANAPSTWFGQHAQVSPSTSAQDGVLATAQNNVAQYVVLTPTEIENFYSDINGKITMRGVTISPLHKTNVPLIINDDLGVSNVNWTEWRDASGVAVKIESGGAFKSASPINLYNLMSDTYSRIGMSSSGISLGAGGASFPDLLISRDSANTLRIDDGGSGAANLRVYGHLSLGTAHDVRLERTSANTVTISDGSGGSAELELMGPLSLGTALDTRIRRSAATTVAIDDGASGAADLRVFGAIYPGTTADYRIRRTGTSEATFDDGGGGSAQSVFLGNIDLVTRGTAPGTPAAGRLRFYVTNDGSGHPQFRVQNSAGTVATLTSFANGA